MKFRVNLLKILRHSFVLLFFVFVFNDRLKAQHWTTCDAQGSDYKIHLTFDKLYNKPCQCRNDYIGVFAAKNSFSSTDSWFIHIISSDSTAGRYDHIVGPGYSTDYYITYFYGGRECPHPTTICNTCQVFGTERNCSVKYQVASNIGATTSSIKKPKNVYATKDTSDTYIDIKWQKGTNIPDTATVSGTHGVFLDLVYYKIYRNDTLIATLNGDKYFYRDAGLAPGRTCKYSVTTFTNKFGTGDHESDKNGTGAYATGSTFSLNLTASDNEFTNKTVLKWRDISKQADEIEVSRFENGKWEQIAVVSKFSKTYNDMDGIPGVEYNYSIQPVKVGATFFPAYDLGSRANNGIISGKVLSPYNAGVSDVVVFAKAVINGDTLSYSDTTDNSGYYEIKGVYYHKSAEFKIYPSKAKHFFKPDLLIRTLDLKVPRYQAWILPTPLYLQLMETFAIRYQEHRHTIRAV